MVPTNSIRVHYSVIHILMFTVFQGFPSLLVTTSLQMTHKILLFYMRSTVTVYENLNLVITFNSSLKFYQNITYWIVLLNDNCNDVSADWFGGKGVWTCKTDGEIPKLFLLNCIAKPAIGCIARLVKVKSI